MIDRNSPVYKEDIYRVKIGHAFLEQGYDINGIVHIGANDGYEVQYYLSLGIEKVICFEPLDTACELFKGHYYKDIDSGKVKLFEYAIGRENKRDFLRVGTGTGQTSSLLRVKPEFRTNSPFIDTELHNTLSVEVTVNTWDRFLEENPDIDMTEYDCLVCDVQGMELQVLMSIGNRIMNFKYLNIECSEQSVYEGEASAQEVIDYLVSMGFRQTTPIEPHNDIMFVKDYL